jgi:Protein of unknown function DUF58
MAAELAVPRARAERRSLTTRLGSAIDRRLTGAGRLVLIVTAFAAGFGVDTTLSYAYQVFSLGLGLLCVAIGVASCTRLQLGVERRAGRLASVGEAFHYEIEIRNEGKTPWEACALRDELTIDTTQQRRPSGTLAGLRDRFRSMLGVAGSKLGTGHAERRWRRGSTVREIALPLVAPGARTRVALQFIPQRRGLVHFQKVSLFAPDPLGLARAVRQVSAPGRLVVLPRRFPVRPLTAGGVARLQQGGVANASSVGDAEEFLGLRDYRPGDPLRRIAWKRWARLGQPIVRENEDEFFVRHGIALDTFCDDAQAGILDAATSVAASIATSLTGSAQSRDALLDLVLVEERAYRLSVGRGTGSIETLLEIIAAARPAPPARFTEFSASVLDCAETASTLILVLLNWDAQRADLIRALRSRGAPIIPIVMRGAHDPSLASEALALGAQSVRVDQLAADLAAL